jgi:endo-1,3-1,4-beta-glycanase ExoK
MQFLDLAKFTQLFRSMSVTPINVSQVNLSAVIRWGLMLAVGLCSFSVSAKPYKAAEIYSKQTYKYGRYEMRMRVAKGSGVLSTFFTYKNGSEQQGTFWEEIDIEVFGKNNATQWQSNVIIGTNPNLSRTEGVHTAPVSLGDGYHTYVLEWTPNYVAWYLDGTQVRRITGGQFVTGLTNPQDLRFNLWAANIAEWVGGWNDNILPVYQFVNYVQYQPYVASTNSFGSGWRDDFNTFDTNRWSKANWTFGENLADFEPNNVVVKNGILVLALTREGQTGYSGTPPADSGTTSSVAPITIQAESFNQVGGSVNVSGGIVDYIDAGEWLKYTNVNILQAGTYKVEYRVASAINTAQFTLDRDGTGLGTISVPNTGGWGSFSVISHNVYLNAGRQNLAIYANSGGFNIDWFKLTKL